ncbi:MAG: threonine/homoserine/homoserine lactone efflux protein [Bacteroidia bacterium]|jgi:threonine/homoserine/homoserine lactone efflux protein
MAFVEGFVLGLGMMVFVGPVFFTLLKSALSYGVWAGLMVVLGIFMSDVVCVVLCSFGAIPFFKNPENQFYLASGGGVILLCLGLKYIFKPNVIVEDNIELKAGHYTAYFAKGFLVNFVNPFVFVTWISIIGLGQTRFGSGTNLWIFLGAALLAIFITDSTKVLFAHRIKKLIQPKFLLRVYQIIGVVMIGFGCRLLWFILS